MFFADQVLAKKGKLARVWLAAHMERRLTKHQLLQTNIPASVETIRLSSEQVLALRITGQLLLGVAVIYSRKTKYLLDDCADTDARIKIATLPVASAALDAALNAALEPPSAAAIAAITLPSYNQQHGDASSRVNTTSTTKNTSTTDANDHSTVVDTLPVEESITLETLLGIAGIGTKMMNPISARSLSKNNDIFTLGLGNVSQNTEHRNKDADLSIEIARGGLIQQQLQQNDYQDAIDINIAERTSSLKRKRQVDVDDDIPLIAPAAEPSINGDSDIDAVNANKQPFNPNGMDDDWGLDLGLGNDESIEVGRDAVSNSRRLSLAPGSPLLGGSILGSKAASISGDSDRLSGPADTRSNPPAGEISFGDALDFGLNANDIGENDSHVQQAETGRISTPARRPRRQRNAWFDVSTEIPVREIQRNNTLAASEVRALELSVNATRGSTYALLALGYDLHELSAPSFTTSNTRNEAFVAKHAWSRVFSVDIPLSVQSEFATWRTTLDVVAEEDLDKQVDQQENQRQDAQDDFAFDFGLDPVDDVARRTDEKQQQGDDMLMDFGAVADDDRWAAGLPQEAVPEAANVSTTVDVLDRIAGDSASVVTGTESGVAAIVDDATSAANTLAAIRAKTTISGSKSVVLDAVIGEGCTRSTLARTFFDVLQLASRGAVKVAQQSPYAPIAVAAT